MYVNELNNIYNPLIQKMNKNNFNLYCLSQKFSKQSYYPECTYVSNDKDIYRYKKGNKYTFVCMGFSAYYVYKLLIIFGVEPVKYWNIAISWGAKLQNTFSSVRTLPRFNLLLYKYCRFPISPCLIILLILMTAGWKSST